MRLEQGRWRHGGDLSLLARARFGVQGRNRTARINNVELGHQGRSRSNVWNYPEVTFRIGRVHELAMAITTVKPVALVADAINDGSHRGGIILDPFAGCGTTIIAAEKTGRRARCMEIEPRYADAAIRRWQTYTGKAAVLAALRRPSRSANKPQRSIARIRKDHANDRKEGQKPTA